MDAERQTEQIYTLVFVTSTSPSRVLLGMKKRGFGAGKWNGYGGKVERNESIVEGAARELLEESNLTVRTGELIYLGHVAYENIGNPIKRVVHIFRVEEVDGVLTETEEMRPKWFDVSRVPYGRMWPDSIYWLPYVLNGSFLVGYFLYGTNEEIVEKIVEVVESAPDCI